MLHVPFSSSDFCEFETKLVFFHSQFMLHTATTRTVNRETPSGATSSGVELVRELRSVLWALCREW